MSAESLFRSIQHKPTKRQIALSITRNTIEEYRALRMASGMDAPESEHGFELLKRLAALMKGPHAAVVRPVVFQAFPELEPPKGTA